MKKNNYARYYRVFKDDTAVEAISTNDFKPLKLKPVKKNWLVGNTKEVFAAIAAVKYALPVNEPLFYGYINQAKAMEMAKAGAMKHINLLMSQGSDGEKALMQYRVDHYDDLHFNLVEANITQVQDDYLSSQQLKEELKKRDHDFNG